MHFSVIIIIIIDFLIISFIESKKCIFLLSAGADS
jgi:hypothetical protein